MKLFSLLFFCLCVCHSGALKASSGYEADIDSDPETNAVKLYPIDSDAERKLKLGISAKGGRSYARKILRTMSSIEDQRFFVESAASFSPSIQSNEDLKVFFDILSEQHRAGNLLDFVAHVEEMRQALNYVDISDERVFKGKKMLEALTYLNIISGKGFLCPITKMIVALNQMEPFTRAPGFMHVNVSESFLLPLAERLLWSDDLSEHVFAYIERYRRAFDYKNPGKVISVMSIGSLFESLKLFLEQRHDEILTDTDPVGLPPVAEVDAALAARAPGASE